MPILEWAEKRVVALRRAQHIRSEQQGLGVTARVTWRPPPGPRSQVLTLASPQLKRSPHVTPKLMGSHSAQELLELSFGRLDRTRIGIDRSLQAQVDEAARVRAHLEAELAEQTASASQLEQACHARFSQLEQECTRLTAEMLEERMACEAEKDALKAEAARCQVQAVDSAVASAMAKERARARMTLIVKALIHAADKKAAVNTAIATMQKKYALSYALRGAAKATKHAAETAEAAEAAEEAKRAQEATNAQALSAEEAAQAAEEAVRAQEGAIKQAIASTREECARELEAAVGAAEAAAAQRLAAAIEALSLEHERTKRSMDTMGTIAADAAAALQAQVDEAARVRAHLEAELAEQTASASQLEQACHARFSQLEQECTRLTAEMLEERTACEAEKDALEAALERNRSRLRAALKASMTLGLVALGVARDGERTSLTSGADAAAFEAATRSEQLNMAQEELWRARRQFASEVRKLRLGLKLMLTLGLAIKDARAASG